MAELQNLNKQHNQKEQHNVKELTNLEIIQKLEILKQAFQKCEDDKTKLFQKLGYIKENNIELPEGAIVLNKVAGSLVILPSDWQERLKKDPLNLPIIVEEFKPKVGEKRFCFSGGAIRSDEENEYIEKHELKNPPANLFYVMTGESLEKGEVPSYSYNEMKENFENGVMLRVKEELGKEVASKIKLLGFLDGVKSTILSTIKLPEEVDSQKIAEIFKDKGVKLLADGRLEGVYTKVDERVGFATCDNFDEIMNIDNKCDRVGGKVVLTLGEILNLSQETNEHYNDFKEKCPGMYKAYGEVAGVRNPSTDRIVSWIIDFLIANLE